ncbi:uncharacterized protein LOC109596647 [Aethina tumida]|uniref:uncharacterized protein LOC109596647 n=1 Tax=Aethina tumida TaxID=116153 RepID=UPI0021479BD5|nr:uncharacterized protein LOC109596647 [Aethina tumida]
MMLYILLVLNIFVFSQCAPPPSFFKACKKKDFDCMTEQGGVFLKNILQGDKQLGIPPLSPLVIPLMNMGGEKGLLVTFKNAHLTGIETAKLKRIEIDTEKQTGKFDLELDFLNNVADYSARGSILVLKLNGDGKSNVTNVKLSGTFSFKYTLEDQGGEKYVKITEDEMNLTQERIIFHFNDLFKGNDALTESTNEVLNKEWKAVAEEVGPAMSALIGNVIKMIASNVFKTVPYSKLFLDCDKKYGIPVIEPFTLSLLEISPGDNLKIVFRNLTGIGLDKAKLRAVKYDANKNHMKILTDLPSLKILGDYDAKGRILVLPIEGKGPFEIEAIDGKYTYSFDIIPHEKKGEIYGSIENGDLDFDIKNVKLNFENLFNGDKTLGSQMNMFLNENWRDVFKDLKGAIRKRVCALLVTVLATCATSLDLPSYIVACKGSDPNFKECVKDSAKTGIKGFLKGDKKYGIPPFTPFKVPLIEIQNPNLLIKIDNVDIYGIDDASVEDMSVDVPNKKLSATIKMERLNLQGHYIADGKIASLPIKGDGDANITFVGGTYIYETSWTIYQKDGEDYMKIENPSLEYKLRRAHFYHGNLFNGNEELGNQVNKFLNDNWELFLEDIGTAVKKTIESIATNIITNVAKRVPFNKIFPQ